MILAARYANPDNTVIVVTLPDAGAKAIAEDTYPDLWAEAIAFGPDPYQEPAPESISPLQARRALRNAGLYDAVVATVAGADDPDLADAWEYATVWLRSDPHINTLAVSLGLTSEQVDDLFRAAAAL